eukprot:15144284-Alexandrium_andersonii.AAC.1
MMAAATSARSLRVAAARPSMPPVLVRAPRQPRRTPLALSGQPVLGHWVPRPCRQGLSDLLAEEPEQPGQ